MDSIRDGNYSNNPGTMESHPQFLSNLNTHVDTDSDKDVNTDDDAVIRRRNSDRNGHAEALMGVSMGRAQTHLKSPATPAAEKSKALEASNEFPLDEFQDDEANQHDQDDDRYDNLSTQPSEASVEPSISGTRQGSSPNASDPSVSRRSSVTRSLLPDGIRRARDRAMTGPLAVIDGLRKMLPDVPRPVLFKLPSSTASTYENQSHNGATLIRPSVESSHRPRGNDHGHPVAHPRQNQLYHPSLDGPVELRPPNLRRTTSDQSLYLRRAVTGASEFDDTTKYASVADQTNSRFKAITDSFADSNFKMPKLSSIGLGTGGRHSLYLSDKASLTQSNTIRNTGVSRYARASWADRYESNANGPADTTHPLLKDALSRATGDLVVLGGYRGSILRSAEPPHHQLWAPVKVGLNIRKVDLEVGLTHEDEERMEEKIIPDGILSHIGPIDISRRLLKKMHKCPNARAKQLRVHNYGYDWRLSPHLLSRKLIAFLESLECNKPHTAPERRGALVIAHSLGGLITRHAVNQRPELFSGVVYAGVPQHCVNILGPLRNGDDVLISSRVLTAQVNFTLRTSFALLPESGRCFLNRDTGERYDVDFFHFDTWDDLRLSPCINTPSTPPVRKRSMISSISESVSSLAPSLPSKRLPWFNNPGSSSSTSSTPASISTPTFAHTSTTEKEVTEAAEHTQEALPSATAENTLEPQMDSNAHSTSSSKPSVATACTIPPEQAREYLERTLREIKQFKAELAHNTSHQSTNRYPPQSLIFGKSLPTVYGAKVASRDAIRYSDAYDDLAFAAGDGVVLASAAQLPPGYRCVRGGRVETDRGHVGILGDLEGIGRCISAVLEGRRRSIGLGHDQD